MQVTTSIHFNGQCEAAFKYYERLGGKLEYLLRWSESPLAAQVPAEWQHKVLHARLSLGNAELVGGDVRAADYRQPQGFSMLIAIADAGTAERVFTLLADGGS